ncbi:MAG: MauE/DoxX family redox-associated membrane protein [Bryobacteraceae bacterium]|jgi:uncharacterized membrane protein YphA (DoxX/SURF4 family)
MTDSMAQPGGRLASLELPGWKTALSWVAAVLLSLLFLLSGLWKITDAQGAAVRMAQARVPESMSLVAALVFGIVETLSGVLILVPRFRRWGSILAGLLLVAFVAYFAVNYNALRGEDCSCFPWVKRVVGPGFFIGDGLMLLLAVFAGIWSRRPESIRSAFLILGAVVVFALVSYGVAAVRETGARAPETITVAGQPYSLEHGRIFLYFFDPECMHCFDAARRMSQFHWGDTKVVAISIQQPQFAPQFLQETGLRAAISTDLQKLKQVFPYVSVPAGVALENGREKASLTKFEGDEPGTTLKQLGFVY